tara:strand:+ start:1365 stop:3857 length:2493 start_codon:yes stop_codon:yes gene_type:complete
VGDYKRTFEKSLEYFDGDSLSASVFAGKYALTDKDGNFHETTPDDMHIRLAKEFARIESQYENPLAFDEIYSLFKDFKYVIPQGSPMSAIGNPYQVQSTSNCFVIESPYDSYGGILKTDQELVQIAKRRGGVGFDLSTIRPKGLSTANAARTTDGIEVFMDRFSNSCREVAQGGRRGALMLTISVHHPQIHDFIKIKQDLARITGANISIRVSDEFMNAVENDKEYEAKFPVDSSDPIVSNKISAREVWSLITESAHSAAEPGVLFWDTAKKNTPSDLYADYGFESSSTNPCGEIILSPYDSCRLMLVNLASFVNSPFSENASFDFEKFDSVVQKAQRLMDDMIDLEIEQIDKILSKIQSDPEPDSVKKIEMEMWKNVRDRALTGRRTGLGITALGDMLAYIGVKYGSEDSITIVEKIYKHLCLSAYRSSCILAKERGSFPIHDPEREKNHKFLSRIWKEDSSLWDLNKKWGRRNIALTTTAPAGSVSTLTQTTSGIEPAYLLTYTRRKKISSIDSDESVDFIDESGDKWQEYTVYHHGFKKWIDQLNVDEEKTMSNEELVGMSPYANSTASEIDWVAKVKMQAAAQKWVCHAISNTTNLPSDIDVETVKDVYMTGWKLGCKGITVYRDGSRAGVLINKSNDDIPFQTHEAPERPQELECSIHYATIKGEAWTILVGLLDGRPYEVMGGLQRYIEIPKKYKKGTIIKHPYKTKNSRYDLRIGKNGEEILIKDIVAVFDNPNHAGFTRTISLALRHGAQINYVVEQLQKDTEMDMFSFSKVIARVLKSYIKDGTKASNGTLYCNCESTDECNVVYQEGCATCLTCGYAKCG